MAAERLASAIQAAAACPGILLIQVRACHRWCWWHARARGGEKQAPNPRRVLALSVRARCSTTTTALRGFQPPDAVHLQCGDGLGGRTDGRCPLRPPLQAWTQHGQEGLLHACAPLAHVNDALRGFAHSRWGLEGGSEGGDGRAERTGALCTQEQHPHGIEDPRGSLVQHHPHAQLPSTCSCCTPVRLDSLPGRPWRTGSTQIVQSLRVVPPNIHPRVHLSGETGVGVRWLVGCERVGHPPALAAEADRREEGVAAPRTP